jgi:hypothetical protein
MRGRLARGGVFAGPGVLLFCAGMGNESWLMTALGVILLLVGIVVFAALGV